jgi:7-keto-8-aminopelargonate synthetase-like enzyme
MTLLLHDEDGIHSFKSIAEQLTRNSASVEKNGNKNEPRVLVYGSFLSAFGLPGAYLTGDPTLLRELRYTSRGYMFTTAQQPFVMAMIAAEVNKLLKS